MNIEEVRSYCLSINPAVTEDFPFDEVTLVFRIGGKIFALLPLDNAPPTINLKCDPEWAIELRELYTFIKPGYHMNKQLWNTVTIPEVHDAGFLKELIRHSYQLIYDSLPKKIKNTI